MLSQRPMKQTYTRNVSSRRSSRTEAIHLSLYKPTNAEQFDPANLERP